MSAHDYATAGQTFLGVRVKPGCPGEVGHWWCETHEAPWGPECTALGVEFTCRLGWFCPEHGVEEA